MKALITISLFCILSAIVHQSYSQDNESIRINIIKNFLSDLYNDKPAEKMFETYLESGNNFASSENFTGNELKQGLIEWTEQVRTDVKRRGLSKISIYKYVNRPDSGRVLKPIGVDTGSYPDRAPLKFVLHENDKPKNFDVPLNNLYVAKIGGNHGLFILFNDQNQMISIAAICKGDGCALLKF